MVMDGTTSVPGRITGKSVEDIAGGLYDALSQSSPNPEEFRLEYWIINATMAQQKNEKRELDVDSRDTFIEAFLQYHREGKYIIEDLSPESDTLGPTNCGPSELDIYYKVGGQDGDHYYTIPKGVENTNAVFSGFGYHRSRIKRFLVDNRFMKPLRTNVLSQCPRAESFLKDVLVKSNACINRVTANPFYITIEQKT